MRESKASPSKTIPIGKDTVIRIEVDQARDDEEIQEQEREERPLEGVLNELKAARPIKSSLTKDLKKIRKGRKKAVKKESQRERAERIKKALQKERHSVSDLLGHKFVKRMQKAH
jgi:hypothetical protein